MYAIRSYYDLVGSGETVDVHAEHVVTATGNHAQRTARLLGIKIPAIPVEHQFVVTEPDPALVAWRAAGNPEHPVLRDADAKWYVREERGGWIRITSYNVCYTKLLRMLGATALLLAGVSRLPLGSLARWSHALAGGVIAASGLAILLLGL